MQRENFSRGMMQCRLILPRGLYIYPVWSSGKSLQIQEFLSFLCLQHCQGSNTFSRLRNFKYQNPGLCLSLPCRYSADFGQEKQFLKWIISYLDATKAGLLLHLLNDSGPINVSYQNFDWSPNAWWLSHLDRIKLCWSF